MHSSRVNVIEAALWFALALLLLCLVGCAKPEPRPKATLWAFTADWCAACQRDKPTLRQIARSGRVRVVEVDADARPRLVKRLRVKSLPTYVLFDGRGVPVWRGSDLTLLPPIPTR